MGIKQGNQWKCDAPACGGTSFVERTAEQQIPDGWLNTEMHGGAAHVVACSPECLAQAITEKSKQLSAKPPEKET